MDNSKKKRIVILGGAGMLGHKLYQIYRDRFDVYATVRGPYSSYSRYNIFDKNCIIENLDVLDYDKVTGVLGDLQADVVINCIGIIKQLDAAKDPILSIKINSLLPHQLANICSQNNSRFFHISTDCVFNGKKGMYTEDDLSNAEDLYGKTKFLGEVNRENCLTFRTSIIGRELSTKNGLVEWFLNNREGKVKGFKKAIYTGFTTIAISKIIENMINNFPGLSGMYQVSSEPIDKFSLLRIIRVKFNLDIDIEPETQITIDRSLDSSRFRSETGFRPQTWEQMISEMANDPTPYDKW